MQMRELPVRITRAGLKAAWVALTSRRQLNLPRWIRGRTFAEIHGSVVTWLDSHFAMVERGAPWLDRVGTDIWDYCRGSVNSPFEFTLKTRVRATAGCGRSVIAVYGFDGDLPECIDRISVAFSAAGWERIGPLPLRPWADANGEAVMGWRPNTALGYPPGMAGIPPWGTPPLDPHMWLVWSSRGQQTRMRQDPTRTQSHTRNSVSVEFSGTEYWKFPEAALADHEHALSVQIDLGYYSNPEALTLRHRIPRYLLPTQPARR
jgi:hypothetical protein